MVAQETLRPAGRALAFMAHPDDAEFLCAGALALLADCGWQVVIVTATPGDCGSATFPPEEIAAIRRREAASAASCIGAEYRCAEERDLCINYDTDARRRFVELVRWAQPDVVITHPLADYMADHEVVGRLVRDACFAAPMPNFRASGDSSPLKRIPHLYYCAPFQPDDPVPAQPTLVVDITGKMTTKVTMLSEHRSQREWLQRQHGIDEYTNALLKAACGLRWNKKYAEVFYQHRGHPYPQDDAIAAALGTQALSYQPGTEASYG